MIFGPDRDVERVTPTEDCEKTIGDTTIEAEACELNDTLTHRTTIDGASGIVTEGQIDTSSETGVVSLTSNPSSTVAGPVKLKFDADDIDGLRRMCYISDQDEQEKLDKIKREESQTSNVKDKYDPNGSGVFSQNAFRADVGLSSDVFDQECEYMRDRPVDADKVNEVEYFIPGVSGGVSASMDSIVPAQGTPASLGLIQEDIEQAARAAENLRADFSVNSCYSHMLLDDGTFGGDYEYARLTEENLRRLRDGEDLETFTTRKPIQETDEETKQFC
jgi:hypothetical protein